MLCEERLEGGYRKGKGEEVFGRGGLLYLGVGDVWQWRQTCHDFLGMKINETEERNVCA